MNFLVSKCNKINGEIEISGSKNAVLPIICASLIVKEKVTLRNVPFISDVIGLIRILEHLGAKVKYECNNGLLEIESKKIGYKVTNNYVKKIRASYYLMGALISRKKYFEIDYPGGCNFDKRPIDLHLYAFRKLNVIINEEDKLIFNINEITPCNIKFEKTSVGATINTILSTVISVGITEIVNASIEPEVIDTIDFLNKAGGCIIVIGNKIIIKGVRKLKSTEYEIMSDRIEAGSYMILASAIPNSEIVLKNINSNHLTKVIDTLELMGCSITINNNQLKLISPSNLKSVELTIDIYPYFPTDLQPIISTALLNANARSSVIDKIYPKRVSHINELVKLNGNIYYDDGTIFIDKSSIKSGVCYAHDLRCGFALIIAGIISDNSIMIENANVILRGYDNIINKLNLLGVNIKQIL